MVDHDDTLGRAVVLLSLLPPGRVGQHTHRSLRCQLVLNEAQLLILLKLVLEFLKLEILLREFLRATDRRRVGLARPGLLNAPVAGEVRGELLWRRHFHSEALATLTT